MGSMIPLSHGMVSSHRDHRLNREINAALADPKMKERFADLSGVPNLMTSAQFDKFIAEETVKYSKVIKFPGIRAE
jgi:tripartite-type tricarboxylate transporter receptor subunit TctC